MRLTPKDIAEFQSLWREEFGEEIMAEVAQERAAGLLDLCGLTARSNSRTRPDTGPPTQTT